MTEEEQRELLPAEELRSNGYVPIARKVFAQDSWPWVASASKSDFEAWLDLIVSAAFAPTIRKVNGVCVNVGRGEFAASERFLSKRWGWDKSKVARFLKKLRERAMITSRNEAGQTVIRLCNYERYNNDSKKSEAGARHGGGKNRGTNRGSKRGTENSEITLENGPTDKKSEAANEAGSEAGDLKKRGKVEEGYIEEGNNTPSPVGEKDSAHSRFIKLWTDAYPLHHGGEGYAFQGGKDAKAVQGLLSTSKKTPEELLKMAVAAWKRPSGFSCKSAASLTGFNSKFNEIRAELNAQLSGSGGNGNGNPRAALIRVDTSTQDYDPTSPNHGFVDILTLRKQKAAAEAAAAQQKDTAP